MKRHIILFTTYVVWMIGTFTLEFTIDPLDNKQYTFLAYAYTISYLIQIAIECLILYMFTLFSKPFDPMFKRQFLLIFTTKQSDLYEIDKEDRLKMHYERLEQANEEIAN